MKKQILIFLLPFYAILFLSGCTANLTDPEIDFEPPAYVEQMPSREDKKDFVSTGSVFGQGENPLFSDHKAMNVYDIVTVIISETAKSSSTGSKKLSESNRIEYLAPTFSYGDTSKTMNNAVNRMNNVSAIGLSMPTSTSDFNGKGSATKDASFTTTVSARIVKILQNGNYFISGKREILVDEQKQIIQISGVIRPYDIDQNNNINSSQMSDAKILYKTEGDVDRATEQGWATKIIQAVWPF